MMVSCLPEQSELLSVLFYGTSVDAFEILAEDVFVMESP